MKCNAPKASFNLQWRHKTYSQGNKKELRFKLEVQRLIDKREDVRCAVLHLLINSYLSERYETLYTSYTRTKVSNIRA